MKKEWLEAICFVVIINVLILIVFALGWSAGAYNQALADTQGKIVQTVIERAVV